MSMYIKKTTETRIFSAEERNLLKLIANRAENDFGMDRRMLILDVVAAMDGGLNLNLRGLYRAKSSDFVHDVFGVVAHLDRTSNKLTDNFIPRYAI